MKINTSSLEFHFGIGILALVFLVLVAPLTVHHDYCSQPISIHAYNEDSANPQQDTAGPQPSLTHQKEPIANESLPVKVEYGADAHPWRCDYHLTDVLLLFFTACLVLIGYYTMRSSDRAVKATERAIVFGGPLGRTPGISELELPPPEAFWTQFPVQMGVTNYGKTAAILKEYCIEFSKSEPTGKKPVYNFKKFNKRALDTSINPDSTGRPTFIGFAFSDFQGPHYCYGYVKYEDIFREEHISHWCCLINPGTNTLISTGGSAAYNDWD